jgi:hypothetical protein
VIVDLVYSPQPTPLALVAVDRGARVINGHQVLLVQARRQFEKMSGRLIPMEMMSRLTELRQGRASPAPEEDATRRSPETDLVGAKSGLVGVE